MKKLFFLFLFFAPIAGAIAETPSGDTYNFYFQKAPGPVTVNQGTQGNTDGNAAKLVNPESKEFPAGTSVASEPKTEEKSSRWSVGVLYGNTEKYYSDSKIGLEVNYHVNNDFLIGVGALFGIEGIHGRRNLYAENPDWFLRLGFTPLHIQAFGFNFIDLGLVAGLMSTEEFSTYYMTSKKTLTPFVGPNLAINLSKSVSLNSELQYNSDQRSQLLAGIRVKF